METEQQELNKNLQDLIAKIFLCKLKEKEISNKQEFLEKYLRPAVDLIDRQHEALDNITKSLTEQIKSQDIAIKESYDTYQEAMKQRELRAKKFVEDKSSDELKEFLADQFVPYNLWKSADHDKLVQLILDCYDEED